MTPGARRGRRGTREPGAEGKGPEVDAVQPGGDSGVAGGREPPGLDQRVESRGLRPVHPRPPPGAVEGGDADLSQDSVRGQVPIEGLPAAQERRVDGIRIRVAGEYSRATVRPEMKILDFEKVDGGTEFTLPEIRTYAVVDLSK